MAMGKQGCMQGLLGADERLASECSKARTRSAGHLDWKMGRNRSLRLSRKGQLQLEYGLLI
jgi:hypothetical protein